MYKPPGKRKANASGGENASDQDIVRLIADELKPWNSLYAESNITREIITRDIIEKLRLLRSCHRQHFDRKEVNRATNDARDIIALIERLKKRLAVGPSEIQMRLNMDRTRRELNEIRHACELAVTETLTDRRKDQTKQWCVKIAVGLKVRFSKQRRTPTEKWFLPTINSVVKVAGLLYEAVTGEADKDLKRICASHLKSLRSIGSNARDLPLPSISEIPLGG